MKKFIATIVALSVGLGATCIALLILLIGYIDRAQVYDTQLENLYKKSLYVLSDNVRDIELDLSKVIATTTVSTQRELLGRVYDNCKDANNNLSNLPISSHNAMNFNSTLNTIGGYVSSLIDTTDKASALTEDELNQIEDIHAVALSLYFDITYFISNLDYEYEIVNSVNYDNENSFNLGLNSIEDTNSGLPTLIYDGPFSDSVLNKEVKGLTGEDIDIDTGKQILFDRLSVYEVSSVQYVNKTTNKFEVYNYTVDTKNGRLYVQITVKGGFILNITSSQSSTGEKRTKTECEEIAESLALDFGLSDMTTVWSADSGEIVYVNLAPVVDNVVYYPDLIKVKVNKNGVVSGWEAQNYAYNHVERQDTSPSISLSDAKAQVSERLNITSQTLCIIPNEYVGETLAYEFRCTWGRYVYYIYIDASTGEEANIMRVVDTVDGSLIA